MTVDEKLTAIMNQNAALIGLGNAVIDRLESLTERIGELEEALNKPADPGLEDSIKGLTEALQAAKPEDKGDFVGWIRNVAAALAGLQAQGVQHDGLLRRLPADVARAVTTGAV